MYETIYAFLYGWYMWLKENFFGLFLATATVVFLTELFLIVSLVEGGYLLA